MSVRIRHLYISAGHNYFGRHGRTAGTHPVREVESVECVAGRGLVGDRFFDHRQDYKGQVTLFSWEVYLRLSDEIGGARPHAGPEALRRNIIVEGADLPALIGKRFNLQGVELEGIEECRPCYWMDQAIGPGAEAWLAGRGGLRCRILTSGKLHREPPAP